MELSVLSQSTGAEDTFSGGHGAMGYALPALSVAYYATGKPVACICGRQAFQMNIQELQWVKRENIPVKMIVMNNEALGMIRHLREIILTACMRIPPMAADFLPVIFRRGAGLQNSCKAYPGRRCGEICR